jgi:molybdenum cofactor biosynthesis enzyme MoaA
LRYIGGKPDDLENMVSVCKFILFNTLVERDPGVTKEVIFELTSRCNLACIYCPTILDSYQRHDMDNSAAQRLAEDLGKRGSPLICISGGGETTIIDGWEKIANTMRANGARLKIITNLNKAYSREEIEAFAAMDRVVVSLDTVDYHIGKRVRARSNNYMIIHNIMQIKLVAKKLGCNPDIFISCVVNNLVVDGLEDLAYFAIAADVQQVNLTNMFLHKDLADCEARPIVNSPRDKLTAYRRKILATRDLLRRHGIACWIEEGLLGSIEAKLDESDLGFDDGR